MVALLWLMFTVRLITAILDCRYIANPFVCIAGGSLEIRLSGAVPLNVCQVYTSSFFSKNEVKVSFKLSCNYINSQVIVHPWNGTECDDDPLIGDHSVESQTDEFNCDSQSECDYLYKKTIVYFGTNCNINSSIIATANFAFITDVCITTGDGSVMTTSCDLSGVATNLQYNASTDCTGNPNKIEEFSSNGSCNNVEKFSYWTQAICLPNNRTYQPTHQPTAIPTVNPTNIPTTNPTYLPTTNPTYIPTIIPTKQPTYQPTKYPSNPSSSPTAIPTEQPSNTSTNPSSSPIQSPTISPSITPTSGKQKSKGKGGKSKGKGGKGGKGGKSKGKGGKSKGKGGKGGKVGKGGKLKGK